jgi:ATP-dependent Clp protease adaptor protein ClpS
MTCRETSLSAALSPVGTGWSRAVAPAEQALPEIAGVADTSQRPVTSYNHRAMADEKKPPGTRRDKEGGTGLVLDERTRTKKPPMYKVLLHNDDYTTREFVVWILQTVFHKSEGDAIAVMSHVHNNGVGVAGIFTFEVAETKVSKTMVLAKEQQYPLQLSIEPSE